MSDQQTCARCGSTRLSKGVIQSTGKAYFRLLAAKFFSAKTADLAVSGNMCLDCGAIELFGDLDKARSLLKMA